MSWKLSGNQRLPPSTNSYWSYNTDSWAWIPKKDSYVQPNGLDEYWPYLKTESKTINNPFLKRGGLSRPDTIALIENTYDVPDLKSETIYSINKLNNFTDMLIARGLYPKRAVM
jgi:hypothetical protein